MKSVLCVRSVELAVRSLAGIDAVYVDLAAGTVKIRCLDDGVTEETIINTIMAAGYTAERQQETEPASPAEQEDGLRRGCYLIVALTLIASVSAIVLYLRLLLALSFSQLLALAWVECICGLAALYVGRKIILTGFGNLFAGKPCMESLTAVGVCAALLYSIFSLYDLSAGNELAANNIYAAAASVVLLWSLWGEYLTDKTLQRATEAEDTIQQAVLLRGETKHQVTADMLLDGDLIAVQKGEIIPADGVIEAGHAAVDESDFTGSSIPVLKDKGMEVMAGSYVLGGELTVKVRQAAQLQTDENGSMTELAGSRENAADKRAALFLPLILIVAVAVSLNWLFYSGSIGLAGKVFTAIMLVTCPCALKLSQSAALLRALRQAAERGIRCSSVRPLLLFREISVVIFGKTGTVTDRKIVLTDIVTYNGVKKEAALILAASLENSSLHPAAGALKENVAEADLLICEKPQYFPGEGISAVCQKAKVCFGLEDYVRRSCRIPEAAVKQAERWRQEGKTPLFLAAGRTLCAVLAIAEEVPQSGKDVIAGLQAEGIRTILMTGDTKEAALRAASLAGIEKYMGALSPKEKLELVSSISLGGEKVAVVSSCHNDCLEECRADLRIAIGCRQRMSGRKDVADIVLQEGRLDGLLQAIRLSRQLFKVNRQGVRLFYIMTILLLPFAAGAFYFVYQGLLAQPVYILLVVLAGGLVMLANACRI